MRSFGYLFVLLGIAAMRQVFIGRVKETPEDARDFIVGLLSGDMAAVGDVATRRGEGVSVEGVGVASPSTDTASGDLPVKGTQIGGSNNQLITEMRRLGSSSGRYVWGATGPAAYDCSGIVWRSVKNLGIYNGPRFTTSTFAGAANGWAKRKSSPSIGDIVVWPGKHMGVVVGDDRMYSARSPSKGIGESSISGDSGAFGSQPVYWGIA